MAAAAPVAVPQNNSSVTTDQRPKTGELLKRMMDGGNLYKEAFERGMGLSAFLEQVDPPDRYQDGLDSFSRMLKIANIRVNSDHYQGYYADYFEKFFDEPAGRALAPEWITRQWRRATTGRLSGQRASVYATTDSGVGGVLSPFVDSAMPIYKQLAPAVPISEVIAQTTPIDSDVYRGFYLTDTTASERKVRVAQGAELPRAKLAGSDHTIRLYKYGRILEVTYEVLRRQRIDLVALHIARIALQGEIDKLAAIMDIMLNGDGNANTSATNYNLTTLDSTTTATNVTLAAWLSFKLKLLNPYQLNTALTQAAGALKLQLLNLGSANIPLVTVQAASGFGSFVPINPELRDNVSLGITADAPSLKVIGFDRRFAIERVFEIGSDITEIERFITRQTQGVSLSEVEGYRVLDPNAIITVDLNA